MIALESLSVLPGVVHGFMTREGGVSEGLYASLNCGHGSGDGVDLVTENRARAAGRLGFPESAIATCHQCHSNRAVIVERPFGLNERPKLDALATNRPGIALGVLTADCAPVLFADPEAGVVAAAHAGWRGALTGVLEAAVDAMMGLGAQVGRVAAAVGPCIGRGSYEVGPEFPEPFLTEDGESERFFAPAGRAGHHMFDLPGYVATRLSRLNLASVEVSGLDTRTDEARFFSYRRASLRGEPDYGRQISLIGLEALPR